MLHFAEGSSETVIDQELTENLLQQMLGNLQRSKPLKRVLLIPPDITRWHSGAGPLTVRLFELLHGSADVFVLPALGTHEEMNEEERHRMFPGIPDDRFRVHHWRNNVDPLGEIPPERVRELSENKLHFSAQVLLSKVITQEPWDAIISIGQLVPHEVIGIANHNKNIFVGCGGKDLINKSHWLGAVYGMERIMGRARTPVRDMLNDASRRFATNLPIHYLLTVRGRDVLGKIVTRGLFAGDDEECYLRGAELAREVNINYLEREPHKVVVYLEPEEFKSTWLGNKAVYRTRMAIADEGELIILAPGVRMFGEDAEIDRLIRQFGYRGTSTTLEAVESHPELAENLSAAAHLIHGSSEGRFRVTYCPGYLTEDEIRGVGFNYLDLATAMAQYPPTELKDGWNSWRGEEIFFVSNPGLGLWGTKARFGA
ncbi:MAG: lactate racemase domain-containing protein [Zavarzinella sp.]